MKILIAEDDFVCRKVLQRMLAPYGECDIAVDGKEALEAYRAAMDHSENYDLICLDIMMPGMDGHEVLGEIRKLEESSGIGGLDRVKIMMTTALSDSENVLKAFNSQCEAYLTKPLRKEILREKLIEMELVEASGD